MKAGKQVNLVPAVDSPTSSCLLGGEICVVDINCTPSQGNAIKRIGHQAQTLSLSAAVMLGFNMGQPQEEPIRNSILFSRCTCSFRIVSTSILCMSSFQSKSLCCDRNYT